MKRAAAAGVATAAAVALAAGMTSPASARPASEPAASVPAASAASTASGTSAGQHHVTLITGDRVSLDAKGRVVGFQRAKGREHIPVQIRRSAGHTLVVPADAARLLASGTLDQRLFDVTELNKAATRKAQHNGLKVIVGYSGAAAAAKSDVRGAGQLRRSLAALNADAVQTPARDTAALWHAVTDDGRTAEGIAHIWLDGVRTASLDKSVPQIGAPTAWKAGYTGKGVKVAVLDTGVDTSHPDLKTQVLESKNFTGAADARDHFGHGTHVASIVAGTGAKSGGKYKGVAPDAKILNGKVLDDSGSGDDSGILAGMEWAAAQGASVVNLSLGGPDSPGVDPLEAEVNKLSAEKGILFAIAAGNDGPQSIGSPGSADAALTVGAVDGKDKLADFSSTGPRTGDGAVKPDVTAPGVDITAAAAKGSVIDQEVGEKPEGYLTISGTSMATPHVAGAAAILKQEHPDWGSAELKGALTASTKGGKYTPFEQGSGRIQVDKAIKQAVVAEPVSVSFPVQQWPHTDDKPVSRQVTYRNLGDKDVTLALSSTATGPKGAAAPAGFFKLAATSLTVPAHGRASVGLIVNTKLGGTLDGAYSAYVTATGGGQTVRTAAAVQREVESYDVTLKFIGRDGRPAPYYGADLTGVAGLANGVSASPYDKSGTVKVRAPKGTYILNTAVYVDPADAAKGLDWIAQPKLTVGKKQTITVDARKAEPVSVTVPASGVTSRFASPGFDVTIGDGEYGYGWFLDSYKNFRTAHLGGALPAGTLRQQWDAHWTKGAADQYDVVSGGPVTKLATGYTKHYKASELSTVKGRLGAPASGKTGSLAASGWLPGSSGASSVNVPQKLPGIRTLHLSTGGKVTWQLDFEQDGGLDQDGFPVVDAAYPLGTFTFKAGKTYTKTVNTAVFGPHVSKELGLFRVGDEISGSLPLVADSARHAGYSEFTSAHTTLYRNGTKVGSNTDPLFGAETFKVPAGDAAYRLTTSVRRSAKVARASSRIDAAWTFRSKKPSGDALVQLPASAPHFGATTGLDSTVPAGRKVTFPVTVEGAAAGRNLKSLTVYVSYDGRTFTKVAVHGGRITVKNPARGKSVSFRAEITDKRGNTSQVTIYDAYFGK
ncbi:S8 family serine peptidase [Streptomyces sp. LP11]|uniref:S8 family serine peptidase n=2 Tax=Streptomyces pyxinicus TaxID=2970331 RepID=A0ABT2BCK0_9ACTN|nr:S8 family serine peptidase [Streptomyces sp. LP11]MCS0606253.1 S8 family serine peptidase [Streptomyces sp. LP11]